MNINKIAVRNEQELKLMRKSGQITAAVLKKVMENALPGTSLMELEKIADMEIKRLSGSASFKTVPGWSWATCLTLNKEVVHGIPRDIKLKMGDILGIDVGAVYPAEAGWHTDAAWTVLIGSRKEEEKFLEVGEKTLWKAISQARAGKRVGDISAAIQHEIEKAGYSVVKSYAGHGVGKSAHEEPEIPTYGQKNSGLKLKIGQTLAIEVIYTNGSGNIAVAQDGWTAIASDGTLAGLFEMSVVVGRKKPEILTRLYL